MNESTWLNATNPQILLEFICDKTTDRQLRLFALACCKNITRLLPESEKHHLQALIHTERYTEAMLSSPSSKIVTAVVAAVSAFAAASTAASAPEEALALAINAIYSSTSLTGFGYADEEAIVWSVAADAAAADDENHDMDERIQQCNALRKIIGNPF